MGNQCRGGIFFIIFGGGNIYSTLSLSSERRGRLWEGYASTQGPIYNARRKNKKNTALPCALPPRGGSLSGFPPFQLLASFLLPLLASNFAKYQFGETVNNDISSFSWICAFTARILWTYQPSLPLSSPVKASSVPTLSSLRSSAISASVTSGPPVCASLSVGLSPTESRTNAAAAVSPCAAL